MKLVVTSDLHLDHVTAGVARFEEIEKAVKHTVDVAIKEKAGVYLFTGDAMDPDSGSCVFRCINVLLEAALRLQNAGIESIWIAGNHDVVEDGTGDTTLTPMRALTGLGHLDNGAREIHLFEKPGTVHIDGVDFVLLPFTSTSNNYDPTACFTKEVMGPMNPGNPIVVAGHLSIEGVIPGEETTEMPRGRDVVFPFDAAMKACEGRESIFINGHYHRTQGYAHPRGKGKKIHIPGSLARLTFGEQEHTPSFLVIEVPNA